MLELTVFVSARKQATIAKPLSAHILILLLIVIPFPIRKVELEKNFAPRVHAVAEAPLGRNNDIDMAMQ